MINFFGALRIWAGLERTAESNLRLGVILSFVAGAMTLPLAALVLLPTAGPLLIDWRRRV